MGKRRVGFKSKKSRINQLENAGSSDEENELEAILDDEIDQFNSQKEQALLQKGNKKKSAGKSSLLGVRSDEEEEVYGLNLDSSDEEKVGKSKRVSEDLEDEEDGLGEDEDFDDDEEDDEDNDDDILGRKEYDDGGNIPDSRAWGKRAKLYHNTDYVDQDFGGMEGEDAEKAEEEEAEAKEIQKRLTAELDEADFAEFLPIKDDKTQSKKKDLGKEFLKVRLDSLSASEKRKLVERQCPEIIYLLEEYREKIDEAVKVKSKIAESSSEVLKDYYDTKYHILLNYCMNISFYLLQRVRNPSNCKGHPVVKKILQYRRLLNELHEFDVKKVCKNYATRIEPFGSESKVAKKLKLSARDESQIVDDDEVATNEEEFVDGEKRKITYEMAKNKGLMPHRKKEQRNPRVKHREKFRKAKIRRKGQVRTARTEKERYGGEATGIKINVTKSIKLR